MSIEAIKTEAMKIIASPDRRLLDSYVVWPGRWSRVTAIAVLLAQWLPVSPVFAETIYQCQTPDGSYLFSDHDCGNGTPVEVAPLQPVQSVVLTEAERKRLTLLRKEEASRAQDLARAHARHEQTVRSRRAQDQAACENARAGLRALKAERRRGYSARDAQRLDQREQRLKAQRRVSC